MNASGGGANSIRRIRRTCALPANLHLWFFLLTRQSGCEPAVPVPPAIDAYQGPRPSLFSSAPPVAWRTWMKTACALREPGNLKPCGVEKGSEDHDMLLGRLNERNSRSDPIALLHKNLDIPCTMVGRYSVIAHRFWYRAMCDKIGTCVKACTAYLPSICACEPAKFR